MADTNKNRHGLTRVIPPETKLEIRKRDGFGCVICGTGIIEYEHVDPEFKDATEHNPGHMTILCPTCHAKKTRGFLSSESVKSAMLNPKCLQQGFSREILDIGKGQTSIIFAGSTFTNCVIPIEISKQPLFMIKQPEIEGGPFRFSAEFYDTNEQNSLSIKDNEWQANTANWDLEVSRGEIVIKESQKDIHLILANRDPSTIEVRKIRSVVSDKLIIGNQNEFHVYDIVSKKLLYTMKSISANDCYIGMSI